MNSNLMENKTSTILKLTVRSVSKLATIRRIFAESFPEAVIENSFPFPDDDALVIADEKKVMIGFCCIHPETPKNEKIPYLYNFCIEKAHRRKGFGLQLMKFAQEKYGAIKLHSALANRYMPWIVKTGYELVDVIKGFAELHYKPTTTQSPQPDAVLSKIEETQKKMATSRFDEEEGVLYME